MTIPAVTSRPIVLHLGDPIEFNPDLYKQLEERFTVVRPSIEERQREPFLQALREQKWGPIAAVMKPYWNTGGEMGRWDRELISLLPESFKVYAAAGAGFDWADVDIMAERGIIYCNGASAPAEAVADMALYHIISVFRNIQWSNIAAHSQDPDQFTDAHRNAPVGARNPKGHTLGMVGLGRIGYLIAEKAYKAFGMKVIYFDPVPKSPELEAAIEARRVEKMDDLLAESDCLMLATPGGARRILDRGNISKLKKGARVVNIGRGNLIDEEALADALDVGNIYAVGLDVHENEPRVSSRLARHQRATLTCHTAGGALETKIGFEELSMRNVLAVLGGEKPLSPVNMHLMKKA